MNTDILMKYLIAVLSLVLTFVACGAEEQSAELTHSRATQTF
ncbi:uncharacterized protein METZ01_LOCUS424406, partial [marine metagenome]